MSNNLQESSGDPEKESSNISSLKPLSDGPKQGKAPISEQQEDIDVAKSVLEEVQNERAARKKSGNSWWKTLFGFMSKEEEDKFPPSTGYCACHMLGPAKPVLAKEFWSNPFTHKTMTWLRMGLTLAFLVVLFISITTTQAIYVVHTRIYGDTLWLLQLMGVSTTYLGPQGVPPVLGFLYYAIISPIPFLPIPVVIFILPITWGRGSYNPKKVSALRITSTIFALYAVIQTSTSMGNAIGYAILQKQVDEGVIPNNSTRMVLHYSPKVTSDVWGLQQQILGLQFYLPSNQEIICIATILVCVILLTIFVISRLPRFKAGVWVGVIVAIVAAILSAFPVIRQSYAGYMLGLLFPALIVVWFTQGDLKWC